MDEEEIKRRVIFGEGYGKPPKQTQFKKGQSGNPKGRPKKASSVLSLADQPMLSAVLAVASKTVPAREGGEMTEMSIMDAVVASIAACAVKGNSRSQQTFVDLAQKAHEAEVLERRRSIERWTEYKRIWSTQIAEAKKRGEPIPHILPHPDDIVIDHAKGPRLLGPFDEEEETKLNETIRLRDILIMQDELDHRSTVRLNGEPLTEPGSAGLIAHLLEQGIPPRLRLSQTQWILKSMKYHSMQQRELLKTLFAAWRRYGSPLPRGFVFPNLTPIANRMTFLMDLIRSITAGDIDASNMKQQELADVIYERAIAFGIAE